MQPNSFSYSLCVVSLTLLALWQNGSCKSWKKDAMPQQQGRVAEGLWGGPNIQIDVAEAGAQLRFTCAKGRIDGPVTLDAEGRFSVKGTFTAEAMGPTDEDNPPKSGPAVYSGVVRDRKMTLSVAVEAEGNTGGTFELTQGEPGRVRRCH